MKRCLFLHRRVRLLLPALCLLLTSCQSIDRLQRLSEAAAVVFPSLEKYGSYKAMRTDEIRMDDGTYSIAKSRWFSKSPTEYREETFDIDGDERHSLIVHDGTKSWMVIDELVMVDDLKKEWWNVGAFDLLKLLLSSQFISETGRSHIDGVEAVDYDIAVGIDRPDIKIHNLKVSLGAADGIPRSIAAYDADGNLIVRTSFSNVEPQVKLDDALFRFTPPDGIEPLKLY